MDPSSQEEIIFPGLLACAGVKGMPPPPTAREERYAHAEHFWNETEPLRSPIIFQFCHSVMVAIHIGAVVALFMFSWRAFSLAMVLCSVAGSLGTGMQYCSVFLRIEVTRPPSGTEYFLTVCGAGFARWANIFWSRHIAYITRTHT